jgi:hypothetical protein
VAFLDSDVVPQDGWLGPLLDAFADPAVGLAAPRIVALPPITGVLGRYEAVRSSLDLGPDRALVVPRSRVAYVPSAALLVRRAAAGAGFDEDLHAAEDVEFELALHAAGWRMRFEPAARVAHDHRTTVRAWALRKAFYGTGAAPLALRHPGSVPPMVLSPTSAAVGALLLLARPWSVPAAVAVGAVAATRLAARLTVEQPRRTAARLVALGAVGAVAQTADAVNRHYWPVSLVACALSRRARRTVAAVALAEGVVDWWRHRGRDPRARPDPLTHLVAHRVDDLAYGAGLWWGALRHRTTAPLRPATVGSAVGARAPRKPQVEPFPADGPRGDEERGDERTGAGTAAGLAGRRREPGRHAGDAPAGGRAERRSGRAGPGHARPGPSRVPHRGGAERRRPRRGLTGRPGGRVARTAPGHPLGCSPIRPMPRGGDLRSCGSMSRIPSRNAVIVPRR